MKIMKIRNIMLFFFVTVMFPASAMGSCPECRAQVNAGVYNQDFSANLFILLLPVLILVAIGVSLYYKDEMTDGIKGAIIKWRTKAHATR